MNGTTIEILNTDAEGRLVLADALVYAETRVKPDAIVDLATLTGAVVTALGHELSGVLGTHRGLQDELVAAGEASGELVWPLPLLEQHKEHMKGAVGDLKNINAGQGAGSSAGAAFLAHFVARPLGAPRHRRHGLGRGGARLPGRSGGTGVGVRLLLAWLEQRAPAPLDPAPFARKKTRARRVRRR
jgi:leucyl aminopeptidase